MRNAFENKKNNALLFIKKIHARQTRMGAAVPDWYHLARVSRLLELILDGSQEGATEMREAVILAGLGHDALEDTDVTREDLEEYLSNQALAFVEKMTNTYGDDHPEPYVQQVVGAEEEVRLIKLADLYDNCTSALYGLFALGTEWAESYFLPIVQPMIKALLPTKFENYPVASYRLKKMVQASLMLLLEEIERYKKESIKK